MSEHSELTKVPLADLRDWIARASGENLLIDRGGLLNLINEIDRLRAEVEKASSENCSTCRHRWGRKGTCVKAVDDNSPGRPWSEPDYKPPWCPGWDPRTGGLGDG